MPYPKGSLSQNRERDYPLLQQLGRSGFATVRRQTLPRLGPEYVYALTTDGIVCNGGYSLADLERLLEECCEGRLTEIRFRDIYGAASGSRVGRKE